MNNRMFILCVYHISRLGMRPHQAAQDVKNKHSDPARDWGVASGVAQVGYEDGLQETQHHQSEAHRQKHVCSKIKYAL